MLFHITATHTPDDCPIYDSDIRARMEEATAHLEDLTKELGVTVHFQVTGAPEHVIYSLLEADDFSAIQQFLGSFPIKQDFTITPVTSLQETSESLLETLDSSQ